MVSGSRLRINLEVLGDLAHLRLPGALGRRLHALLDQQDRGEELTNDERAAAEGLVEVADLLTLIRSRSDASTPSGGSAVSSATRA
jgi:hypothetical protein